MLGVREAFSVPTICARHHRIEVDAGEGITLGEHKSKPLYPPGYHRHPAKDGLDNKGNANVLRAKNPPLTLH
jgi:hypothetical protein